MFTPQNDAEHVACQRVLADVAAEIEGLIDAHGTRPDPPEDHHTEAQWVEYREASSRYYAHIEGLTSAELLVIRRKRALVEEFRGAARQEYGWRPVHTATVPVIEDLDDALDGPDAG